MRVSFSERDKTLGLIVCATSVIALIITIIVYVLTDSSYAVVGAIWVSGWWFGATLVWLGEKHYHYKKNRLS